MKPCIIDALRRLGFARAETAQIEPLAGGVSSNIVKVMVDGRLFVVKQALSKLKVEAEWRAPLERNRYEVAWLQTAASVDSRCVPEIVAHDEQAGLFAMAYLDPVHYPVWKGQLRDGLVDLNVAAEVGRRIASIHSATAGRNDIAARFSTDHIFYAIRLEPYLEATAVRHPAIADALFALSKATLAQKRALVHGDVSPKNILIGPRGPVFLDAECAWYGDPAFDLAFCLNHLLLKGLWNKGASSSFLDAFDALRAAYFRRVDWEPMTTLEARVAALLPALLLARIDGKSPVEYISTDADRMMVRSVAVPLIAHPPDRLGTIREAWHTALTHAPPKGADK